MAPSELSLSESYSVARGTVRSALALLVEDGLLEVVRGQGRRVVSEAGSHAPATAYERIAADLLARISAGEFGPSDPLPSEATLTSQYEVSRNTVRRAYKELADAGAVVIKHGAGAFPTQ
jgi:DNA-binding GntR family transcriptional regulator